MRTGPRWGLRVTTLPQTKKISRIFHFHFLRCLGKFGVKRAPASSAGSGPQMVLGLRLFVQYTKFASLTCFLAGTQVFFSLYTFLLDKNYRKINHLICSPLPQRDPSLYLLEFIHQIRNPRKKPAPDLQHKLFANRKQDNNALSLTQESFFSATERSKQEAVVQSHSQASTAWLLMLYTPIYRSNIGFSGGARILGLAAPPASGWRRTVV